MKNKLLAATAIVAAAGLVAILIKKRMANKTTVAVDVPNHRHGHHLTNVFAKAKEQVV